MGGFSAFQRFFILTATMDDRSSRSYSRQSDRSSVSDSFASFDSGEDFQVQFEALLRYVGIVLVCLVAWH
jgi:hypothetical protein